jgi:hypothetical protein
MKQDEIGCTQVWMKEDDNSFHFHPDCYEPLRAAWMNGEAFYTGRDCYDEPVTIRLGQVIAVSLSTPSVRAQAREDRRADKLRDGDE